MKRVLFICSGNKDRSPTAEHLFSSYSSIDVSSACTRPDADERVSSEQVLWADIIFVMENRHRKALMDTFPNEMKDKKIINLEIPDNYVFMDEKLVAVLKQKVERHLSS